MVRRYLRALGLVVVLAGARRPLHAQPSARGAMGSTLILAQGGVARVYNAQAGVQGAEFLGGVYKSFGTSPDSRSFLYLKAEGGRPTFELYIQDLESGAASRVATVAVHHASWSPDGTKVAYQWLDDAGRFHVSIFTAATRQSLEVGSGRLKVGYLEWAPDSSELLYLTVAPIGAEAFETGQWDSSLHRHSLRLGSTEVIPGVEWAQYSDGQLVVAGNPAPRQYRAIPNPKQQQIDRFLIHDGQIYANLRRNGREVVSRWDATAGTYQAVTTGRLVEAVGADVLIRDYSGTGVDFKLLPGGSSRTAALSAPTGALQPAPAGTNWRLPYYGRAGMVQGGYAYSDGSCDGAVCLVVAHVDRLNYALDFQQVSEANDGNQHILAVEAGTVVSVTNDVACSSNIECTVSLDGYSSTCNDPNSGAANSVVIAHLDGSYSLYGHLRSGSIPVKPGQTVSQGTHLGDQGHTGSAFAPNHYRTCGDHLHFQRQTAPTIWSQSIPTDFEDAPCLMACTSIYPSKNVELAPAPTLTQMQPLSGLPGSSGMVTLTGADFLYGTTLAISGVGVTAGTLLVDSATQATTTLMIAPDAAVGPREVTLTTARGTSASFQFQVSVVVAVTLTSQPSGLTIAADGQNCVTPCVLHWNSGTVHSVSAPATVPAGTGTRYSWRAWSDGGALAHSVTAPVAAVTYAASYVTQYTLTTAASPADAGSITPVTGWYDGGLPIPVTASPSAGFAFSAFSGALTGGVTPRTLTLAAPSSVTANFAALYSLSRAALTFAATAGGRVTTPPQEILVGGAANVGGWTASSASPWLSVSPSTGRQGERFSISLVASAMPPPGTYIGKVTVAAAGASTGRLEVTCTLIVRNGTNAPFGFLETPADGATGLAGSVPVTGWALDDIGVNKVTIWRDPVGPEPTHANGFVYIGDAIFVAGARPDVEKVFSSDPLAYRAGWGYLLLTNTLPSLTGPGGNGVYKFHAIAVDEEGNQTLLGTKTITVDNKSSKKPFGTIDTPGPGETISGSSYVNSGWALTPQPSTIPLDGSTMWVNIDGVSFAHPVYNQYRPDVASIFPGYANSAGSAGAYLLDTTKYANGTHTISWVIYDNGNHADGVGSRYLEIQNAAPAAGGDPVAAQQPALALRATRLRRPAAPAAGYPAFRTGYKPDGMLEPLRMAGDGLFQAISLGQLDRVEIHLPTGHAWQASLRFGDESRPLPIGSTMDGEDGVFYWQLGPGFLGRFDLEFTSGGAAWAGRPLSIPIEVTARR